MSVLKLSTFWLGGALVRRGGEGDCEPRRMRSRRAAVLALPKAAEESATSVASEHCRCCCCC